MTKSLGFGNKHLGQNVTDIQDKLSLAGQMKPQPLGDDLPSAQAVERAVAAQDETIRQTPLKIASKRKNKGIVQPLNMRVRLATHNRFVELSKTLRLPYDETIEWILDRAGVDEEGKPPLA
ncbi:hypothetical protein [Agrobacterium tumefaciens]|uniref:hypothetical protein n=1 Tax=Agrobacterium tumefaciens TaxID=358 RepID=UPI001572825B|nr:hypothetical protein [Agrobacterium tumefaciens]NSX94429.1 hypothetical protein [Agrobacterium tumefaciens]